MNREIKFRAWHTVEKKIVKRVTTIDPPKKSYILMQYTGLKDKKGKDIYEGDIIMYEIDDYLPPNNKTYCVVKIGEYQDDYLNDWYYGVYEETVKDTITETDSDVGKIKPFAVGYDDMEVVGNIYENPELLEEKDD